MTKNNHTFGAALIVAGTTIGAGMLAMPLTSAEMGFTHTMILLFSLWALLTYSALLFVEAYQKALTKDAGIASLAEQYFGMFGRILTTLVLVVFMYAILSAYATGGGDLLAGVMPFLGDNAHWISVLLFTLVLGAFVISGAYAVDLFTRFLFILKLLAFVSVLVLMLPKVSSENLMAMPLKNFLIISASPVFFTSFGFHGSIASINAYLSGDTRRLRTAIIVGTSIPFVAYVLWQLATHGVLSQSEFVSILRQNPSLNGLVIATSHITGSDWIGGAVRLFSTLALITSFLGVGLGLYDCIKDLLQRAKLPTSGALISVLTLAPPLVFALFFPEGFIMALGYAGQMFTFYAIVLPVALVWRIRRLHPELPYRVWGGKLALIITLVVGLFIMIVPFLINAGYFPAVFS